jgi:hypothetical protein
LLQLLFGHLHTSDSSSSDAGTDSAEAEVNSGAKGGCAAEGCTAVGCAAVGCAATMSSLNGLKKITHQKKKITKKMSLYMIEGGGEMGRMH